MLIYKGREFEKLVTQIMQVSCSYALILHNNVHGCTCACAYKVARFFHAYRKHIVFSHEALVEVSTLMQVYGKFCLGKSEIEDTSQRREICFGKHF